jgi:DNA primase
MEPEKKTEHFDIPDSFTLNFPDRMIKYMTTNHVLDAWKDNRVELYHDVVQNRAVFMVKSSGQTIDAVGRALGKGIKWHRYGKSKQPFIVKTDVSHAIVVEDAASAAAVSQYATGIALLGTHLTDEALELIAGYRSVTVALDRDAANKALHLTKRIKQFTTATMKLLKEDPKVYPRGVIE